MNEKDFYVVYGKYKNATSFDYEKDKEDFMVRDGCNTIAHYLVWYNKNFLPTDPEILSLKNDAGNTVAHYLEKNSIELMVIHFGIIALMFFAFNSYDMSFLMIGIVVILNAMRNKRIMFFIIKKVKNIRKQI